MTAPPDQFADRIEVDPVFGCWLWTGNLDRDGYGWAGRQRAHRVLYQQLVGPIGDGLLLDHLCRRRACCNPVHLEPVTGRENDLRRAWRYRARRASCPHGHSLTSAIVTPEGGRLCRTCRGTLP